MAWSNEAPRSYFVAHNRNHVRIFAATASVLRERGCDVRFVSIAKHQDRAAVERAVSGLGFPSYVESDLVRHACAGDVICVGNDWGPKSFVRMLDRLKRRGVRTIGVVEGARFAIRRHYSRVHQVLCWGPSGVELLPGEKVVVGSAAIESVVRPPFPTPERPAVLINYKFTRGAAREGPIWARAAARAAQGVDPDYVISAHPLNAASLYGLNLSPAPFLSLLNAATLLITRSSTAIYEALAARVNVIYFPIPGEWRGEFAEPMGAFKTAEDEDHLKALVADHARDLSFDEERTSGFLSRHVDIDRQKPAYERMADVIASQLGERAPETSVDKWGWIENLRGFWRGGKVEGNQ